MRFANPNTMGTTPISQREMQLLRKEIETLGEIVSNERLENKVAIDELRLEMAALRSTLAKLLPGFSEEYERSYEEERQRFDPERAA